MNLTSHKDTRSWNIRWRGWGETQRFKDSEDSLGIEPGEIDLDLELEGEEVSKSDSIADLPIGPDEDRN